MDNVSPGKYIPENGRFYKRARRPASAPAQAVFLDRDGVLIEDTHHLRSVEQLNILPGAAQALKKIQDDFCLVVITNQSAVARGLVSEETLQAVHAEMNRRFCDQGVRLDALYYCPHFPDGAVVAKPVVCGCRKPKPGMLVEAQKQWDLDLSRSFLVGDRPSDIGAAQAAGVRSIFVEGRGFAVPEGILACVPDLAQAVQLILSRSGKNHNEAKTVC